MGTDCARKKHVSSDSSACLFWKSAAARATTGAQPYCCSGETKSPSEWPSDFFGLVCRTTDTFLWVSMPETFVADPRVPTKLSRNAVYQDQGTEDADQILFVIVRTCASANTQCVVERVFLLRSCISVIVPLRKMLQSLYVSLYVFVPLLKMLQ
jgi:hypothetical protein